MHPQTFSKHRITVVAFGNTVVHLVVRRRCLAIAQAILVGAGWLAPNYTVLFVPRWSNVLQNLFSSSTLQTTSTTISDIILLLNPLWVDLVWFSFYVPWWLLLEEPFLWVILGGWQVLLMIATIHARASAATSVLLKISCAVTILHSTAHNSSSMLCQGRYLEFVFAYSSCPFYSWQCNVLFTNHLLGRSSDVNTWFVDMVS